LVRLRPQLGSNAHSVGDPGDPGDIGDPGDFGECGDARDAIATVAPSLTVAWRTRATMGSCERTTRTSILRGAVGAFDTVGALTTKWHMSSPKLVTSVAHMHATATTTSPARTSAKMLHPKHETKATKHPAAIPSATRRIFYFFLLFSFFLFLFFFYFFSFFFFFC
jgi:hypothetical protein